MTRFRAWQIALAVAIGPLVLVGCGDSEPAPRNTETKRAPTGVDWQRETPEKRKALARECKAQVASKAGFASTQYQRVQAVDTNELQQVLDGFYAVSANERVAVQRACARLIGDLFPEVKLSVAGDRDTIRTTKSTLSLRGSVSPGNAIVYVERSREADGRGEGWYFRKRASVRDGRFRVVLDIRPYRNEFRVTAKSEPHTPSSLMVAVVRPPGGTTAPTAPQPTPSKPRPTPSLSGKRFTGNGAKNLGTLRITVPSVLRWTNDGDIFQIFDDDLDLFVNSTAHSGDTAVEPGTYRNVEVNALGNWTITITPL